MSENLKPVSDEEIRKWARERFCKDDEDTIPGSVAGLVNRGKFINRLIADRERVKRWVFEEDRLSCEVFKNIQGSWTFDEWSFFWPHDYNPNIYEAIAAIEDKERAMP